MSSVTTDLFSPCTQKDAIAALMLGRTAAVGCLPCSLDHFSAANQHTLLMFAISLSLFTNTERIPYRLCSLKSGEVRDIVSTKRFLCVYIGGIKPCFLRLREGMLPVRSGITAGSHSVTCMCTGIQANKEYTVSLSGNDGWIFFFYYRKKQSRCFSYFGFFPWSTSVCLVTVCQAMLLDMKFFYSSLTAEIFTAVLNGSKHLCLLNLCACTCNYTGHVLSHILTACIPTPLPEKNSAWLLLQWD